MSTAKKSNSARTAPVRAPQKAPAAGTAGPAPQPSAASYGVQPGPPDPRVRREREGLRPPSGAEARPMKRERPSDELRARRQARLERGVVDHGFDKRLSIDPEKLDTHNFEYYWAQAREVPRLEGREWEVVPKEYLGDEETTRHAGYDEQSKPTQLVLMRKYKPWDIEDRARRINFNKEQDKALLRGRADVLTDGGGGIDYVPRNNSESPEDAVIPAE